ncbi:hypothetical protein C8Q77DRAFT_137895 [Trametes polyzona]|nr:hypothetical protein C8Q77DRAFT_137895 [Trametes polyzona]
MSVDNSSSLPLLLDEALSGPLYGLPPVQSGLQKISAYQRSRQGSLHAHRKSFELELLSWKALWNADLPIHSLPAELLIEIFTYLLQPDKTSWRPWTRLMGVCRHWCALIRRAPAFWTDVWVTDRSLKWFELTMLRARKALVCINISGKCDLKAAVPVVVTHADHIRKLYICIPSTSSAHLLEPVLATLFPHLVDLNIDVQRTSSRRQSIDVRYRGSNCPRLSVLSLARLCLPWTVSLIANLHELTLTSCRLANTPLSMEDFLGVLEHGQRLSTIHLRKFLSVAITLGTSAPHSRVVVLSNLRSFRCIDLPDRVAEFIPHIRGHERCTYALTGLCSGLDDPFASFTNLLPRNPAQLAAFEPLKNPQRPPFLPTIFISCLQFDCSISCSASPFSGGLDLRLESQEWGTNWGPFLDRALQELAAIFKHCPPLEPPCLHLDINGVADVVLPSTWDLIFDALPAIQRLSIDCAGCSFPSAVTMSLGAPFPDGISLPESVLEYFAHSFPAGPFVPHTDWRRGVRLPSLQRLSIHGWGWDGEDPVEAVLACLRSREMHGVPRLHYLGLGALPYLDLEELDDLEWDDESQWERRHDFGEEIRARLSAVVERFEEY